MPNNQGTIQSQKLLVVGGYVTLFAAFLVLGVVPVARGMSAARAQIGECKSEIAAREAKSRELEGIEKLVKSINLDTQDYSRLVPGNLNFSQFLNDLYREWTNAGITDVVSVRSLPPTSLGRSQKLPVEVRGKATYAQIQKFLQSLENLERLSSVGRLALDADVSMNGTVEVQLTLFIYSTKPAP